MSLGMMNLFLYLIFWMKPSKFLTVGAEFISSFFFYLNLMLMVIFIFTLFSWFYQTSSESNFLGFHSLESKVTFKLGMVLFIISEVCFFFSFFWTYFHSSLSSDLSTGLNWPPLGISIVNPFSIPLMNSIILISSGLSVTISHYECFMSDSSESSLWLLITIFLGWLFLILQMFEYNILTYSFSDSVFGSIFFLGTGFHGLHVFVGSAMLTWMVTKMFMNFSFSDLMSFEMSIWYWHFVDVVWLFLYFWFYWWPL